MDEKTEELRDIFVDVADEDTVTAEQSADRGSLTDRAAVEERIAAVVATMREEYDFETDLPDDALARLVVGFYEGEADAALAEALATSKAAIRTARFDLHLVREEETAGVSVGDADLDAATASEALPERARRAVAAERAARRASRRYRSEFEERLGEAGFDVRLTDAAMEDGLREATEDSETDVDL